MNNDYALLGLLIKKPDLINDCQLINKFEDPFSEHQLNVIFANIKELYYSSGKVNRRELMKLGAKDNIPVDFYPELIKQTGFEEHLQTYVGVRYDSLVKSRLQVLSHRLGNCTDDELNSAEDYLGIVRKGLDEIEKNSQVTTGVTLPMAVGEVLSKAIRLTEGDQQDYLKTGISSLDRLICGLTTKTMSIIGARPSVGKSALGLTLMSNLTRCNIASGFLSVEMSEAECAERIIQMRSSISIYDFAKNTNDKSMAKFTAEAERLKQCKLTQITRTTDRRLGNIRSIIRNMKNNNPDLKVVFIDYLQKIQGSSKLDRRSQVDEVSATLTDIATDLDIHVCALAQLNRDGDEFPRMKNLKESGGIEQDAHYVFLIHRDLAEQAEGNYDQDCILFVAKNRGGRTGKVDIKYNARTTEFYDNSAAWGGEDGL
jgi:replicative DNA helicase